MPIPEELQKILKVCKETGVLDELEAEIRNLKAKPAFDETEVNVYVTSIQDHVAKINDLIESRPNAEPTRLEVEKRLREALGYGPGQESATESNLVNPSTPEQPPVQVPVDKDGNPLPMSGVHHPQSKNTQAPYNRKFMINAAGDRIYKQDQDILKAKNSKES